MGFQLGGAVKLLILKAKRKYCNRSKSNKVQVKVQTEEHPKSLPEIAEDLHGEAALSSKEICSVQLKHEERKSRKPKIVTQSDLVDFEQYEADNEADSKLHNLVKDLSVT